MSAKTAALPVRPVGLLTAIGGIAFLLGGGAGYWFARSRPLQEAVVVKVNGVPITQAQFTHRLEVAAGANVLNQMIAEEVQLQFAKKLDAYPTDAEVETKLQEARKDPDFARNLAVTHQTEDDIRHNLRVRLAQTSPLTKGVTVSDAEVRAYYEANTDKTNPKARYYVPEAVTIAIIVTPQEAQAKQALGELAHGKPFEEVVRMFSKDRSAANGGVLSPIRRGQTNRAFSSLEEKLFALKPGDQIGPLKVGENWWIVRCMQHVPETTMPFEQVREACQQAALLEKGEKRNGEKMGAAFDLFRQGAKIEALSKEYMAPRATPPK